MLFPCVFTLFCKINTRVRNPPQLNFTNVNKTKHNNFGKLIIKWSARSYLKGRKIYL